MAGLIFGLNQAIVRFKKMTKYLDLPELLKVELAGKNAAMGRYDDILWKIRSGYLVVLAATLGFFVSEGSSLKLTSDIVVIIIWFSVVAWMIDINFRRRQLRVTRAYNELISSAFAMLPDDGLDNIDVELFHISGERLKLTGTDDDIPMWICLFPSIFIYFGTSIISTWLFFSMS